MLVVIDGRMILPHVTGVGRYLVGLISELKSYNSDITFELWVQSNLPNKHPVWKMKNACLKIRSIPIKHFDIRSNWHIPTQLKQIQPNLFHYPHFDLPLTTPGEIVVTIYDLKYIARPNFFPHFSRLKRLAIFLMLKYTTKRAERIISISQSTKEDLIQYIHSPKEKIDVIPLGVEKKFFQDYPESTKNNIKNHYDLDEPFILFIGERRPHKNIPFLIKTYSVFRRMVGKQYHLLIVGKPYSDYRTPEKLTEELNLKDYIHFIDYIPDEDLPKLYQSADVFVSLSLYEGFGLPILEAMASGTPTVVSNETSHPEVVGNAGLLVPTNDPDQIAKAIMKLITGGEKRDYYVIQGLNRANQFSWSNCAHKTLEIYNNIGRK